MIYFAFDLETTGLDINNDEPVQIAFSLVSETGEYKIVSLLVNTKVPIDPKAQAVHGINKEMTKEGIDPSQLVEIIDLIFKHVAISGIIGYNSYRYDVPMLSNMIKRYKGNTNLFDYKQEDPAMWYLADEIFKIDRPKDKQGYDLIKSIKIPKGTKFTLSTICKSKNIELINAHDASSDLDSTIKLWKIMKNV